MTRPDGLHGGHAVAAALLLGACLLGRSARATTEVPAGTYDTVTWTAAGNPYKILGNLTITQLTVEAGTEVLVQVPGVGASYSISVTTLVVNGTPASPVTFQGDAAGTAQSAWRGLWVAGSASVTGAIVRNASDGIRLSATVTPTPSSTISRTRFEYDSYAVIIEGGDVTIDAITAVTLNHGIWNDQGKTVRLTNSLFRDTFNPIISRVGSFTITNCTILHAPTAAVDFSPASTTATLQILNTIIANGTTGVRVPAAASGQITIAYSDIFGNVVNLDGAQLGEGNISADPAAYNVTDYHLYPTSPCIDKGRAAGAPDHDLDFVARPKGAGVDMGAYEYDPAGGRGGAGGAASGGAGGGGGGAGGSAGAGGGGRGGSAGAGGSGGGSGGSAGATGGSAGAGGSVIGGSGGSAGATGGAAGRGGATGTAGTAGGATGTAGTAGGTTGIAGAAGGTGGATGAGGRGGAAGSAGVGGVGGSAGGAAGGAGGHPTTPAGNDGCGCRTAGTPADAFAGVLWLLAFLPIARPRRRRAR